MQTRSKQWARPFQWLTVVSANQLQVNDALVQSNHARGETRPVGARFSSGNAVSPGFIWHFWTPHPAEGRHVTFSLHGGAEGAVSEPAGSPSGSRGEGGSTRGLVQLRRPAEELTGRREAGVRVESPAEPEQKGRLQGLLLQRWRQPWSRQGLRGQVSKRQRKHEIMKSAVEAITYACPKMEAGVMLRDQQLRLHPAAHHLSPKRLWPLTLKPKVKFNSVQQVLILTASSQSLLKVRHDCISQQLRRQGLF